MRIPSNPRFRSSCCCSTLLFPSHAKLVDVNYPQSDRSARPPPQDA
jgi:hypothetical protein